jgi:hypothetical protein
MKQTVDADTEIKLCQHSGTTNVQLVSNILLDQVMNLRVTDSKSDQNLDIVGGSIDKVAFVRNAKYV